MQKKRNDNKSCIKRLPGKNPRAASLKQKINRTLTVYTLKKPENKRKILTILIHFCYRLNNTNQDFK